MENVAEAKTQSWAEHRQEHWFALAVARGVEQVLASLAGEAAAGFKAQTQKGHAELWEQWQEPRWFETAPELQPDAVMALGCAAETMTALAALVTGEGQTDDPTALETFVELLNQTMAALSAATAGRLQDELRFSPVRETAAPDFNLPAVEFLFRLTETNHLIALVPSPKLLEMITIEAETAAGDTSGRTQEAASENGGFSFGANESGPELSPTAQSNLSLLLEVDLDLSVSFGRTRLAMQDVLKLASGSIVELNRSVSDPVDVLINNAVVARGEVVVVEGNYGIRITEVVSRKERIRSIF
jgi:flagellar motor switch protein FliN/FliY